MKCERCGIEHDGSFGSGRYCSRACANSRGTRTKEVREKISNSLKGTVSWNKGNKQRVRKVCKHCGSVFEDTPKGSRKFCSKSCANKGQDRYGQGGYREGSGRSKSGYYKGVYCGSTYELVWVIYRLDNNLPVNRFDGFIEGNGIRYYPDFVEGNHIIELKGFWSDSVDKKCNLATELGYTIDVLYKEDLKKEFEWVQNNYEYTVLQELYDDSKDSLLTYVCCECGKEFVSNTIRKTKIVYCSAECSGRGANKIRYEAR